jgi:shikimate kinase
MESIMENIILTGYMGSGKTSVGKNIAKLVRYTFVDTDEMIVEQQRRSISDIFATDGEQAFRDMETALLRRLIDEGRAQLVISTGGGMPLRAENRQLLAALGRVVYLKASPGTIYNRIKGDTTRPLLQCRNPMRRIEEMLAVRGPLYEEGAMFTVDVNKLRQSEAAEACIRYLRSAGCVFV